jgi:D-alanine-D-alanine ligase
MTTESWRQQLTKPVAVLLGGRSPEREISLQSGEAVLAALRNSDIAAVAIDTAAPNWLIELYQRHDYCFIALHGAGGEDGVVQGALETIGVSYTGSGVLGSALAQNKLYCKRFWCGMDLPITPFVVLTDTTDYDKLLQAWDSVIVKTARVGSSIGMSKVDSREGFAAAYAKARQFDDCVLAEQFISGKEFTVPILDNQALPVVQIVAGNAFYDYHAKYKASDTRYICPCGLSDKEEQALQQLAITAFESVGCSGWGRVDVMQTQQGEFLLLEVNTVPGMTQRSLVPMAAQAAGISFEQLVVEILRLGVAEDRGQKTEDR